MADLPAFDDPTPLRRYKLLAVEVGSGGKMRNATTDDLRVLLAALSPEQWRAVVPATSPGGYLIVCDELRAARTASDEWKARAEKAEAAPMGALRLTIERDTARSDYAAVCRERDELRRLVEYVEQQRSVLDRTVDALVEQRNESDARAEKAESALLDDHIQDAATDDAFERLAAAIDEHLGWDSWADEEAGDYVARIAQVAQWGRDRDEWKARAENAERLGATLAEADRDAARELERIWPVYDAAERARRWYTIADSDGHSVERRMGEALRELRLLSSAVEAAASARPAERQGEKE